VVEHHAACTLLAVPRPAVIACTENYHYSYFSTCDEKPVYDDKREWVMIQSRTSAK